MAQFFVDRPIFAWVIALFIMAAGALSITLLPIAQYPAIAPPEVVIRVTYPGATAAVIDQSITSIVEQELNGAEGLLFVESVSQANGTASITATFRPGTNPDLAAVDVQNRLKRVEARLPPEVVRQGLPVEKARSNFLLFIALSSKNPDYDPTALGDYLSRNVINEIRRVPGVGQAQLFGSERAMRVWIDTARLESLGMDPADVLTIIRAQNLQVAAGGLGERPSASSQPIAANIVVRGQLPDVEAFQEIRVRANPDGST
ncbi:MAG: efflux RND transporter permease subunit, partial [Betaproteobacteria bacterium]|nr:efflux RND transporter permease subunit [Betaproteobacteria bacterium]